MEPGTALSALATASSNGPISRLVIGFFHVLGYDPDGRSAVLQARSRRKIEKEEIIHRASLEKFERRFRSGKEGFSARDANNIVSILSESLNFINNSSNNFYIDFDKFRHLFEKAKLVSDLDMQKIWARVLAGEVNQPGLFSKRSFDILSSLSKDEAINFTKICSFVVDAEIKEIFLYELSNEFLGKFELCFDDVTSLQDAGLIKIISIGFDFKIIVHRIEFQKEIYYFNKKIGFSSNEIKIPIGSVILTNAGRELYLIAGAQASNLALDSIISRWVIEDLSPFSFIDNIK